MPPLRLKFVANAVKRRRAFDDVIDMPPLRLKFVANAVKRRRAFDTLSIFDAQAALIDEKSLNRLNRELRDAQK